MLIIKGSVQRRLRKVEYNGRYSLVLWFGESREYASFAGMHVVGRLRFREGVRVLRPPPPAATPNLVRDTPSSALGVCTSDGCNHA